jgi:hypothetical protein
VEVVLLTLVVHVRVVAMLVVLGIKRGMVIALVGDIVRLVVLIVLAVSIPTELLSVAVSLIF